jgi:hypothetical protein
MAILVACSSQSDSVDTSQEVGIDPTTSKAVQESTTSVPTPEPTVTVSPTLSKTHQKLFAQAFGTSERVCVDVDLIVATEDPVMLGPKQDVPVYDVRSGEIVAGNFLSVVGKWAEWEGGNMKIYWVPYDHVAARTGSLTVVVEPLDTDGPAESFTFDQTASNASGMFWPSGTRFPQPGRYRLTATAPGHWGCFEVTV